MEIKGKCYKYGNNIDTDRIIPGKYTKTTDMNELAAHALEDLDPDFKAKFTPGGILVAGDNFGCGSSREQAPLAIKHVGIAAVAAKSFARIFYRNAINIGLTLVECDTDKINDGDEIAIDLSGGKVTDLTNGNEIKSSSLPSVMLDILNEGGLVPYLKKNKTYILK